MKVRESKIMNRYYLSKLVAIIYNISEMIYRIRSYFIYTLLYYYNLKFISFYRVLRTFPSMNRLLLTGTPLQNNLAELWALLNFLLPEIFDDLPVFESWFNVNELQSTEATNKILKQEEEKHILSSLREILKPFVLRREKSDVHINIPPKKELIVYAPLSHLQHELYRAVLNYDLYNKIEKEPILKTLDGSKPKRKRITTNTMGIIDNLNNELTSPVPEEESTLTDPYLLQWQKHINITDQNRDFLQNLRFQNRCK